MIAEDRLMDVATNPGGPVTPFDIVYSHRKFTGRDKPSWRTTAASRCRCWSAPCAPTALPPSWPAPRRVLRPVGAGQQASAAGSGDAGAGGSDIAGVAQPGVSARSH